MERLQASMADQLGGERHVQRALIAASKAADEIRDHAEDEARRILREAEERGQSIVQRQREEARAIEGQIDGLLARRREVEASLESFIKSISDELEHVRQQQPDEAADSALAKTG
jgi:cell division septum initiation protein DivIVA